jgi:hypothetical protein
MVWEDLTNKFSYKYPNDKKKSYSAVWSFFKQAVFKIFKENIDYKCNNENLVLDHNVASIESRKVYLNEALGIESSTGFAYSQQYPARSNILKILIFLQAIFVFFFVMFFSIFSKNKAQLGLIVLEFVELTNIYSVCSKTSPLDVYFFSPYEKDALYISNFLMNILGLRVILIPSSNPITNHYQSVIGNIFAFTAPYQANEYKHLKKNWITNETINLPIFDFKLIEKTGNKKTVANTIGLLSGGTWLRNEKNRNVLHDFEYLSEQSLHVCLREYLLLNKEVSLVIYLHPIERSSKEIISKVKSYYLEIFDHKIEFAPFDQPSRQNPQLADLAISPSSSSMFERLYAGYKVLFYQEHYPTNYYKDNILMNITAYSHSDFNSKVDNLLRMDGVEYFKKNNLNKYKSPNLY